VGERLASGAFGRAPAFFAPFFSGKKKEGRKNCYRKKISIKRLLQNTAIKDPSKT
jgi:hypothetical protein